MGASVEPALLKAEAICKAFPGVVALDSVDFELRQGEVHALMGENGAGKSTLIKVITGALHKDSGDVFLQGKAIAPRSPADAQALGISTVYQEVNLIPTMTVADNIVLGREPMKVGRIDGRGSNRRAKAALERLGVEVDPGELLGSCSIAVQQLVAIARALDFEAKVLILDEPTSSLDAAEVQTLFQVVRSLIGEGLGVIFVSHFLDQVYDIADRVTILRNGRVVGTHVVSGLPRLKLVAQMLGRSETEISEQEHESKGSNVGDVLLKAEGIGKRRVVEPLDLSVRSGEVLGFAGLLGSGRSEAAGLLFGTPPADHGRIELDGKPVNISRPAKAIRSGIGLVPEDRKAEALFPNLSVRENIVLALQVRQGWVRTVSAAKQRELADRYIKALRIATPGPETAVAQLSGGNQQKVVLARWLAAQPRVLILDEPTRGIDVGAKAEVEKLMRDLAGEGLAIILIATDLEEVVRDSHRVVVMRDRRKVAELEGEAITVEALMRVISDS